MHKLFYISLFLYLIVSSFNTASAQQSEQQIIREGFTTYDSIPSSGTEESYWLTPQETLITTDTVVEAKEGFAIDTTAIIKWKPDPMKATWWGAIIPGMGQIMNKKYWKLPIVYGGFLGGTFAITYFSNQYNIYKTALNDIRDFDPTTNSYLNIYPEAYHKEEAAMEANLKTNKDNTRRYRDLSIFITIAWYGLTILEAYVDAQLYDFDISSDLSLRVQPTIINNDLCNINQYGKSTTPVIGRENAFGVQLSFTMK